MGCFGLDSSGSGEEYVKSSCESGNEHSGSINTEKRSRGYTTRGLSSRALLHRVRRGNSIL
jgi:hypothetical protein